MGSSRVLELVQSLGIVLCCLLTTTITAGGNYLAFVWFYINLVSSDGFNSFRLKAVSVV